MGIRRPLTVIGSIFMLAALGIGVFFFLFEYPRQAGLTGPEGRTAPGLITGLGTEQSGKYSGYFGDIQFSDEHGGPHRFRAYYSLQDWENLRRGQTVEVRYLAKEPNYAVDPNSYKGRRDPRIMVLLTFGILIFGFILFMLPRVIRS